MLAAVSAVVLAVAASPVMAKEWGKIRIATEGAYPPFNFTDKAGKLQGFDVDIANALCAEMKASCTIVAQDWDGIIPALNANKYDAVIASMSITEERKKKVSFSGKYYTTPAKFVRKKGSGIEINDASLKGKQWFLGDQLSGADIQMSFPLEASVASGLIDDQYPEIQSYVERIHRQPSYQEALLKGGKYDYA